MTRDDPLATAGSNGRDPRRHIRERSLGRLVAFALHRIDEADDKASAGRVQELRDRFPDWTTAQLAEHIVRRKCQQAAAIGAATAGSALLPGLGTVAALTLGTAADVGATLKLQTELVLEIAAAHGRQLSADEKRRAVLLVSGLSLGGNRLVSRGGARLSLRLTERFAQQWLARALPVVGVAACAGVDVLSTYLVGRRAHAYFALGPQAVGSWAASLRALSGLDERTLAAWLRDRTTRSATAGRAGLATVAHATRRHLSSTTARATRLLPRPKRGPALQPPEEEPGGRGTP